MLCSVSSLRAASASILRSNTYTKLRTSISTPRRLASIRSSEFSVMASVAPPSYHVLQYKYVPDILERRDPYRAEHLQGAKDMAAASKIVMAGALTDPVDGAIFVFRNVTKEEIEEFVRKDPYVVNGLVPEYHIRPYMVVADSL